MMKKIIAVTGKTGIGKTYLLKKYNYKNVIYLDDYVKNILYVRGHSIFEKIITIFGKNIITKNKINTNKLGKIVLNDLNKLEILSSIVNPQIKTYLESLQNDNYIVEIAAYINYEDYFKKLFNKVILLTSKHIYSQKFSYMNKKIETIKKNNIKYDYLINLDKKNYEILFFTLLDKLLVCK